MWNPKLWASRSLAAEEAAGVLCDELGLDAEEYCAIALDDPALTQDRRVWWSDILAELRRLNR